MLDTKSANRLQTYIKNHPGQKVKGRMMDIAYGGTIHPHHLFRIPIDYLIYNIRNGRFAAELLEREEQIKRKLKPSKKEDAKIIRELLLEQNSSETKALREDLIKNGQMFSGIITFDGAVINANRRMAVLHILHEKTNEDKYKYLLVGILPKGIEELDLWKIEAGIQFGRDFKIDYAGVNELLKLREGEKQRLSPEEISAALLGKFTPKEVKDKLDILKLIDSYLGFINKKGEYHLVTEEGDLEKFTSLQKSVILPLSNKHGKSKKEIAELTAIAFALIYKTDVTHWNIRELKNISNDSKANSELFTPFRGKVPGKSSDIKLSKDKLTEAFTSAQEIVANVREIDKPERLLKKAKSALEGVNVENKKLKEKALVDLLNDIQKRLKLLLAASLFSTRTFLILSTTFVILSARLFHRFTLASLPFREYDDEIVNRDSE